MNSRLHRQNPPLRVKEAIVSSPDADFVCIGANSIRWEKLEFEVIKWMILNSICHRSLNILGSRRFDCLEHQMRLRLDFCKGFPT